jgi:GNAT superfamily N-acetyltransferase
VIRVEIVPRRVVRPLQLAVLRPGQQLTDADLVDEAGAFYVASYDSSGGVAGVAAFLREAHPDRPGADQWRLRGMASEPSLRGGGFGAAALGRGLEEVAARGGVLVWCNARTPAVPFYEAHGFSREGSEFVIDPIGPHYRMSIRVGRG